MSAPAVVLILGALGGLTSVDNQSYILADNSPYCTLPRFWTSVGFCPAGGINHRDITATLLSAPLQMNLQLIAALPVGAVSHLRVHWLLEMLEFVQYTQSGVPIYDYTALDEFLLQLDELGLYPVIEFMANPGEVFLKNPNRNAFLWEDFAYKVTKHYLNMLGAKKLLNWRFESWNEPDLHSDNLLNFTVDAYYEYLLSLRSGLAAAGKRDTNSLHFPLRGPAGLFKAKAKHPLCWHVLEQCNKNLRQCPIEVLTYHRKGNGTASAMMQESSALLLEIQQKFPALEGLPVANDEADPIESWSTPQPFHEDVRYAVILAEIVLQHWNATLRRPELKHLESISHDNAFLSYHPHEFSQRTLLAHFRMNASAAIHSQFIQKLVYAALGLLSKLGSMATVVETLSVGNCSVRRLKTMALDGADAYLSWLLLPVLEDADCSADTWQLLLPVDINAEDRHAYIIEILEQERTDPAFVWHSQGRPAYPNAKLLEEMRRRQTPALHATGELTTTRLSIDIGALRHPWLLLLRVCSKAMSALRKPQQLNTYEVTKGEVLLTWRELIDSNLCLSSYEVWYLKSSTADVAWRRISTGWHLPFPAFQYAPADGRVNGFYKVRGVDVFNQTSEYSDMVEYIEL